ncbi:hypothetical protein HZC31_03170 [Candidatus Woesearchaeota archaeon]|nr:hypothetical protein [Candidatus Woesearchaeota archaeon]
MKPVIPEQKMAKAEKDVKRLHDEGELKELSEQEKIRIAQFYEQRSIKRLETASLIFLYSSDAKKSQTTNVSKEYSDYGEVVTASYYAMYYIVHAFFAKKYGKKLKENTYQVHAKTNHLVLYYLVNTKQLATQLYEEYVRTMATAQIQKTVDDFQGDAFRYVQRYDQSKEDRETSTYNVEKSTDERHAKDALATAKEFIQTIRELMVKGER